MTPVHPLGFFSLLFVNFDNSIYIYIYIYMCVCVKRERERETDRERERVSIYNIRS